MASFNREDLSAGGPDVIDALEWHVATKGDSPFLTFIEEDGRSATWSYRDLGNRAASVAATLRSGVTPGDRVLILVPPSLEYVASLIGCFYAGVVAVPLYPPDPWRPQRTIDRLVAVARDANPATAIVPKNAPADSAFNIELESRLNLKTLTTVSDGGLGAPGGGHSGPERNEVALLQYTSGSTGNPKGVIVTHQNILANVEAIADAFALGEHSCAVSWLPPFHDLGLIGCLLGPLIWGARSVIMAPETFLRRPVRWLAAISEHRGTYSAAPNFAYDLCARRISPDETKDLDLSTWDSSINGGEPVRAETIQRFNAAFAACGLAPEVVRPGYGLAESTLVVSLARTDRPRQTREVSRRILASGLAVEADCEGDVQTLTSSGTAVDQMEIAIVDPTTGRRSQDGVVGEIWVRSPSVTGGYWARVEESRLIFGANPDGEAVGGEASYLRTGDLGFMSDGELFVTGRAKDLIVIRGENYYPQDIEQVVDDSDPRVRPGCAAAVGVGEDGEESLAIVCEIKDVDLGQDSEVIARIRSAVTSKIGVSPTAIVLLAPRTIPKTSSGKIRRRACYESLQAGQLPAVSQWVAPSLKLSYETSSGPGSKVRS